MANVNYKMEYNSMKQLTWRLVLPLTIISFTMFTKWWNVEVDEYKETLKGFPLPYVCPGWHTSLSLQIFVFEFVVDIIVYFLFWFLTIMAIVKFVRPFRVPKPVVIILFVLSGLSAIAMIALAANPDNIITTTRPFEIKILKTGYRFMW